MHKSVDLVRADTLCGRPATVDAPIVLAYSGGHFEGLLPADTGKTVEFKRAILRDEVSNVIKQNAGLAKLYGCPMSKSPVKSPNPDATKSTPSPRLKSKKSPSPVKIVLQPKS